MAGDLSCQIIGGNNGSERRGRRAAWRAAVLREIDDLIADRGLSAVTVGQRLGITARYVHLLLEDTGQSFSQLVLAKRLERTAALLRATGQPARKISEISSACGFGDLSYFNRVFRKRYGRTPSDFRKAANLHGGN
jgi:AraC-like DNA-binding protein